MAEEGFFKGKGVRTSRAQGAIDALSKIKDKTWKEMANTFNAMADFAKAGGMTQFLGGTVDQIKNNIQTSVTGMFAPVINEISQLASDVLKEFQPMIEGMVGLLSDLIESTKNINFTVGKTNVSLWDAIMTGLGGLLTIIPATIGLLNDAISETERIQAEQRRALFDVGEGVRIGGFRRGLEGESF